MNACAPTCDAVECFTYLNYKKRKGGIDVRIAAHLFQTNKEVPQNFAPHQRTYGNQDSLIIYSVTARRVLSRLILSIRNFSSTRTRVMTF